MLYACFVSLSVQSNLFNLYIQGQSSSTDLPGLTIYLFDRQEQKNTHLPISNLEGDNGAAVKGRDIYWQGGE